MAPSPVPTRPVFRANPVVMSDSGSHPVFSTTNGIRDEAIADGRGAFPLGPARKEKMHGGSIPLSQLAEAALLMKFYLFGFCGGDKYPLDLQ